MKQFEYFPLSSELKKQTGIEKDQYKCFKDQINVNKKNRKDDIKKKKCWIDDLEHGYIGDKYEELIDNISKSRLRDRDFRLTEFHNQKRGLKILLVII